ncbi:helix-turn-helix transcriptional regulator [Mesonia ostreae]|uniref:WYL domain-containing protein n=1 Tax=Mesonia ostreae TaxID=861110 RepID=A0ABU2KKZ8_9FLAO|nr:WYL domain-containing protein [Mesonia ostreae]MDT0295402.1 WYL domain-containing protein [Mesonia ostreae]
MATYKVLKRLTDIAKLIESHPEITKKELLERLLQDYDLDIAERTFERDKKVLELDYGIVINYNYHSRGYSLEENEDALNQFFKFTKFAAMAEIYENGIKDYKSFQKWVLPEDSSSFTEVEHFETIIHAISIHHQLSFIKENYYGETKKEYTVSPLCIKEYANRWYLIAVAEGENYIRNFGIDRLSALKIKKSTSKKIEDFKEQLKQYDQVVGLNYSESQNEEAEEIVIKAHNNQLKYLRSLPIHKSQICIDGTDTDWGKVTYHLKPNYEFEMQILKLGNMVEVLEPKWFRDKVKEHIDEMYHMYR